MENVLLVVRTFLASRRTPMCTSVCWRPDSSCLARTRPGSTRFTCPPHVRSWRCVDVRSCLPLIVGHTWCVFSCFSSSFLFSFVPGLVCYRKFPVGSATSAVEGHIMHCLARSRFVE